MAEQVNQRRDKDKHSKKGSSRPKVRALSGIKSPCAEVKQAFTEAVAINASNPICKKGLGSPYVCCGAADGDSPCLYRGASRTHGGDKSWLCPSARASASPAPVGAGGNPGSRTQHTRTRRPHQLVATAALTTAAYPAAHPLTGSGEAVGSTHHGGPAHMPRGQASFFPTHRRVSIAWALGCPMQHHLQRALQPPPRPSAPTQTQSGFSFSPCFLLADSSLTSCKLKAG